MRVARTQGLLGKESGRLGTAPYTGDLKSISADTARPI